MWFVFLWKEWGGVERGQRVPCTLESFLHLPDSGPFSCSPSWVGSHCRQGRGPGPTVFVFSLESKLQNHTKT